MQPCVSKTHSSFTHMTRLRRCIPFFCAAYRVVWSFCPCTHSLRIESAVSFTFYHRKELSVCLRFSLLALCSLSLSSLTHHHLLFSSIASVSASAPPLVLPSQTPPTRTTPAPYSHPPHSKRTLSPHHRPHPKSTRGSVNQQSVRTSKRQKRGKRRYPPTDRSTRDDWPRLSK